MIEVIDNFLSKENFEWFLKFATKQAPYWAGSKDRVNTPATGMVSPINLDSEPMKWFDSISDLNLHDLPLLYPTKSGFFSREIDNLGK